MAHRSGLGFSLGLALELGLGAIFLGGNFPRTVQGCYLKMLFQRKTLVTETYCVVNLPARVLQLFYSRTPPQVFTCEFIPEHPRAAISVLSLIKLLVSIKSKFSPRALVLYLIFRSLSLFYHGDLEILISSSCKHNVAIFINTVYHFYQFNLVLKIFCYYIACGRKYLFAWVELRKKLVHFL